MTRLAVLFLAYAVVALAGRSAGDATFGIFTGYACLIAAVVFAAIAAHQRARIAHNARVLPRDRFAAINARYPQGYRLPRGDRS